MFPVFCSFSAPVEEIFFNVSNDDFYRSNIILPITGVVPAVSD